MTSFLARHFTRKTQKATSDEDGTGVKDATDRGEDNDDLLGYRGRARGSSAGDASASGAVSKRQGSSVPFYVIVEDDDLATEPDREDYLPKSSKVNKSGWRTSVAGESYDPEADDSPDDEIRPHSEKTPAQRRRLAEAVKDILLFRSLGEGLMSRVIDAMFERKVSPGEFVIRQGDDGDNFYVIEKGVFDFFKRTGRRASDADPGKQVLRLDGRGSFGELALMYNQPRAASVVAVTDGVVWAMDRQSFRRIVMRSAHRKRQMYERVLKNVSFLKTLSDYERATVADALHSITYADGDVIIREGDSPATGMYIIERGAARVTIRVQPASAPAALEDAASHHTLHLPASAPVGSTAEPMSGTIEKVVAWLGVGDYFGEFALLEDVPRSASVYAVASDGWLYDDGNEDDDERSGAAAIASKGSDEMAGKVVVAFLERDSFERLLGPCRDIMQRNTRSYTRSVSMSALASAEWRLSDVSESAYDVGADDDTFL